MEERGQVAGRGEPWFTDEAQREAARLLVDTALRAVAPLVAELTATVASYEGMIAELMDRLETQDRRIEHLEHELPQALRACGPGAT